MSERQLQRDMRGRPRQPIGVAVALCLCLLLAGELALQIRSYHRTGQSALSSLIRGSPTVYDEFVGAVVYRPSRTIAGSPSVTVNRFGLRGPEIPTVPAAGEMRVAVLGASSVMGTLVEDDQTSSRRLEEALRAGAGGRRITVVNAGIPGLLMANQVRLLEKTVLTLQPRVVIWYPGTNDIGCVAKSRGRSTGAPRVPVPGVPRGIMTGETIVKNTAALRRGPAAVSSLTQRAVDYAAVRKSIQQATALTRDAGVQLVVVTVVHSFRTQMSDPEIARRAQGALYFRPCFSPRELAEEDERFNGVLRDEAAALGVPLIDAAAAIPADESLFGDSNHFSPRGELALAALFAAELRRLRLLQDGPS